MANGIPIPDAALEQHVAVVGKTGSGKSYAAQGIVERLITLNRRVCIIDPTDRYWGLRLLPDGKKPSHFEPVIFGGHYADMPLSAAHGAALAEIVGTTTTPVIIATRLMTVGERTRFFTDFAEALLRVNQGPLHLVIDEAHLFMPKGGAMKGTVPAMLHAGNNLVSLGRGIGLRIMMLSQRPAKLHNDSLTQAETLVAFRLIYPHDRNAVRDWVREWADDTTGADLMASLPSLPTGTAWVWAPELDILKKAAFPPIVTYDSGKPLAAGGKGPALKPIDLAAVRGKLEIVAKEAIENDPRRLKAQVAELERKLRQAEKIKLAADIGLRAPDPAALQRAREEGYREGEAAGRAAAAAGFAKRIKAAVRKGNALVAAGAELADALHEIAPAPAAEAKPDPPPALRAPVVQRSERAAHNGHAAGSNPAGRTDASLTPALQRILDALAQYEAIGFPSVSRTQLGFWVRLRATTGNFGNYLGSLRASGLVEYPTSGQVGLTDAGRALAAPVDAPPDTAELHRRIRDKLQPAQWRIIETLIGVYPNAVTREELGEAVGLRATTGNFGNYLGALRSLGLVDYPAPGQVSAQPVLFVDGEQ